MLVQTEDFIWIFQFFCCCLFLVLLAGSSLGCLIASSCHGSIASSDLRLFLRVLFWSFMTLTVWKSSGCMFCRMSLNLGLSPNETGVMEFVEENPSGQVLFLLHHMWHGDGDFYSLAEVLSARFLSCKLLYLFKLCSLPARHSVQPTFK